MCQYKGKCTFCEYVHAPINPRLLYESTDLPHLWEVFSHIISIGGVTKYGFNLSGFSAYALGCDDLGVNITHSEFWAIMSYFLAEQNNYFMKEMKKNGK